MSSKDFTIKLGQDEISRILGLKEDLDYWEILEDAARGYLRLGWSLAVVDMQGKDLGVDFQQSPDVWSRAMAELSWQEVPAGLAVRTGNASHLLVVEGCRGEGELSRMDREAWQAETIAQGPLGRERHFYALPEGSDIAAVSQVQGMTVYGDGALVLAPPSREPENRGAWRWLVSPQERPPRYPGLQMWRFLREQKLIQTRPGSPADWEPPFWEEIYRVISSHPRILQALLAPAASPEDYYREVAQTAWAAGLQDPGIMLGLLWHAPLGDAQRRPERWEYLQQLAADPPQPPEGTPAPEDGQSAAGLLGADFPLCHQPNSSPEMWRWFFQMMAEMVARLTGESRGDKVLLPPWAQPGGHGPAFGGSAPGLSTLSWAEIIRTPGPAHPLGLDPLKSAPGLTEGQSDVLNTNNSLLMAPCQQELIYFFWKNYISIDPEWAGLPVNQQLTLAHRMAQDFLRH
ncbi:MAG: hypothetical protein FJ134_13845 [Deltaproteobacteria bacterium]|nr:hypothetical protein [Deltaproteobacteria bacterium]